MSLDKQKLKNATELRNALEQYDTLSFMLGKESNKETRQSHLARMGYLRTLISVLNAGGTSNDLDQMNAVERAIEMGIAAPDFSKRTLTALQRSFGKFLATGDAKEYRNTAAQSGVGSVSNSDGPEGGYFVPMEFETNLSLALKQTDDLLNPEYVNVDQGKDMSGRSKTFAGWDLSSISSVKVDENTLHAFTDFPTASRIDVGMGTHRADLCDSMEFDQDSYFSSTGLMARAFGVAFARGIGAEVAGTLLAGAVDSGVTIQDSVNTNSMDYANFSKLFYALNKAYRNSPKCAFVMNDLTVEKLRLAKSNGNLPYYNVAEGVETLFGKRILVSPTVPGLVVDSGIAPGVVIFGDLSHLVVRLSQTAITANAETKIEFGQVLYTARKRAGSAVLDPSDGANSPIIYGTISAA